MAVLLWVAVVCGDPVGERAIQAEVEPLAPHEIRLAIREALRDEATAESFESRAIPLRRLCALYADLWLSETLAEAQRESLKPKLRSRLKRSLADLTREFGESIKDTATASPGNAGEAAGGTAVADHAAELIELITTTLAPETWEQNGGEGSIYYFNNFRVLVVRQTAEIHHRPGR